MASKIRVGDSVIVIAGKDKGKTGDITGFNKDKSRVVVQGVNLVKKHVKPNPNAGVQGGIISQEAALDISNIAIVNPTSNKADKVGFKTLEDGKNARIYKSDGEVIDV